MNKFRTVTPLTDESEILASYVRAIEIMESYGLENITTRRQEKNGTLAFNDPVTGCQYAIYSDGAVRRLKATSSSWNYRLNRSESTKNGDFRDKRYIYQPSNYALLAEMIGNAVENYRIR